MTDKPDLRDLIAIEAMKTNLARVAYQEASHEWSEEEILEFVSTASYKLADAMLKARGQ